MRELNFEAQSHFWEKCSPRTVWKLGQATEYEYSCYKSKFFIAEPLDLCKSGTRSVVLLNVYNSQGRNLLNNEVDPTMKILAKLSVLVYYDQVTFVMRGNMHSYAGMFAFKVACFTKRRCNEVNSFRH